MIFWQNTGFYSDLFAKFAFFLTEIVLFSCFFDNVCLSLLSFNKILDSSAIFWQFFDKISVFLRSFDEISMFFEILWRCWLFFCKDCQNLPFTSIFSRKTLFYRAFKPCFFRTHVEYFLLWIHEFFAYINAIAFMHFFYWVATELFRFRSHCFIKI